MWHSSPQGPAAVFSYDVLDVGDTYCNTLHQYEVEIQNRGKIDVHYALTPPATDFGSMFTFEPSSGHLLGGQIQSIKVCACTRVRMCCYVAFGAASTASRRMHGDNASFIKQLASRILGGHSVFTEPLTPAMGASSVIRQFITPTISTV